MRAISLLFLNFLVVSSLGPYKIDPKGVSVGGLSSGAYFAVQFQVAYSKLICGAAIYAGGPYYCAEDSLEDAVMYCMSALAPDASTSVSYAQQFAGQGTIDPLSNLAKQNVYVYSGTMDFTVKQEVVQVLVEFYTQLGVKNITTEYSIEAGHGFPTLNYGVLCMLTESPYLTDCNYDGAGAGLQQIYGNLRSKGTANPSNILSFDQSPFTNGNPSSISMGPTGYAYVPTSCQRGRVCRLHVNFHGCQQTVNDIGSVYYTDTGLNDWAETNNIIVLYPQVQDTELTNPEGCWDWWGYTESTYSEQSGPQMAAVKAMIDSLMGN